MEERFTPIQVEGESDEDFLLRRLKHRRKIAEARQREDDDALWWYDD